MNLFNQEPYSRQQIIADMRSHYTNRKTNHDKVLTAYYQQVSQQICHGVLYARQNQLALEHCPINWDELRRSLGKYNGNTYWLDWLHQNYPLVKIIKKGNNIQGNRTMVTPLHNLDWRADVEEILTPEEIWNYYFENIIGDDWADTNKVIFTPIDTRSLEAFILDNMSKTTRTERLEENLAQATKIVKILAHTLKLTGEKQLPQLVNESGFGRQYLSGVNLQSASKELRHACLGRCYEYDIEASVFAWKLYQANAINNLVKFPATLEYLDRKDSIRRHLANQVFEGYGTEDWRIKIVKQAITAVGFGARATNAVWVDEFKQLKKTSLREIIVSPTKLNAFLTDPWVKEFLEEQVAMTNLIYNHFKTDTRLVGNSLLINTRGILSKNKVIAWLYQHAERTIIESLKQVSQDRQVLLTCHDAFYTRLPVNLVDLRDCLQQHNPLARISKKEHKGWTFHDVDEHKRFIEEETRRANGGEIPQHIQANNKRIQYMKKPYHDYTGSDEFDNGYRSASRYDYAQDPFYKDEK